MTVLLTVTQGSDWAKAASSSQARLLSNPAGGPPRLASPPEDCPSSWGEPYSSGSSPSLAASPCLRTHTWDSLGSL